MSIDSVLVCLLLYWTGIGPVGRENMKFQSIATMLPKNNISQLLLFALEIEGNFQMTPK